MITRTPHPGTSILLLLLLLFCYCMPLTGQAGATSLPLVNDSPDSPCTGLSVLKDDSLVFASYENGDILAWTLPDLRLIQVYHTGRLIIQSTLVHENGTMAAILKDPETLGFSIQVWDWKSGIQRFSLALDGKVLHGDFMDQGRSILLSQSAYKSLVRIDTQRGEAIPVPENIRGILDFFLLSAREDKILTYSSISGSLKFYSILDGKLLLDLSTEPELKMAGLFPDGSRRYVSASKQNSIMLVDVTNGQIAFSQKISGSLLYLGASVSQALLQSVSKTKDGLVNQTWHIAENQQLTCASEKSFPNLSKNTQFSVGNGLLVLGNTQGSLSLIDSQGQVTSPNLQNIDHIQSFCIQNKRILAKTSAGFWSFELPEIAKAGGKLDFHGFSSLPLAQSIWKNLDAGNWDSMLTAGKKLILWNKKQKGRITSVDIASGATSEMGTSENPLFDLNTNQGLMYALESNGKLKLWANPEKSSTVQINHPGSHSALALGTNSVVLGNALTSKSSPVLVLANPLTGEELSFMSTETSVLDLIPDPSKPAEQFYSLSLSPGSLGEQSLRISLWNAKTRTSVIVAEVPGSDPSSQLRASPEGKELFLCHDGILSCVPLPEQNVIGGNPALSKVANFEATGKTAARMEVWSDMIWVLNNDGTLSAWSRLDRKHLWDLVLFKNGDLIALSRDGSYAPASSGGLSPARLPSESFLNIPSNLKNRGMAELSRKIQLEW